MHIEMNVCRCPCSRRRVISRRLQSTVRERAVFPAWRWAPSSLGRRRSSGLGLRPWACSHPESFHSARIAASVGCTGTSRVAPVLVPFSFLCRDDQATDTVRHPRGLRAGS